jgi:hypothetical protein
MLTHPRRGETQAHTGEPHGSAAETPFLRALMASPLSPEAEVLIPALTRHLDGPASTRRASRRRRRWIRDTLERARRTPTERRDTVVLEPPTVAVVGDILAVVSTPGDAEPHRQATDARPRNVHAAAPLDYRQPAKATAVQELSCRRAAPTTLLPDTTTTGYDDQH